MLRIGLASIAALLLASVAVAQESALLVQEPALSATDICFTFAGDIWVVPRAGGSARRLTASPNVDSGCRFSPDGRISAVTRRSTT